MADNITLDSMTGGAVVATDDITNVHYQIIKLAYGALDSQTIVSTSNGLPVSLLAGSASIGVLGANSGVDIGDITINNAAGASAVNIQDGGNTITVDGTVAITSANLTTIAGAVSGTEMQVDVLTMPTVTVNAHAVTNAGTFAVQVDGSALTALQLIDDTIFADDVAFTPATSKVGAIGFLADETATDSVDEGDIGIARMTLDRLQHVVAQLESNTMRISGVSVVPKFVIIDCATSGDNTILAAVNPKKIRVLACNFIVAADVTVRFESGAGGTALTGQYQIKAGSGLVLPYNPVGWFETASNTLLNLELSGAVSVDGSITYIEV